MKKKLIIPSILSGVVLMGTAVTPVMVSAATQRIAPPTDSATLLSRTYTELYDILNGKTYYVSIKDQDTGATKTVAYSNGNTYVETVDDKGNKSKKFVYDNVYYDVNDDKEEITYNILNIPTQDVSVIDFANLKFQMSDTDDDAVVEQFKCGSNTEYYYFDSKNNIKQIVIEDRKGDEHVYEILAFTDDVPNSIFQMPSGYEVISAKYKLSDTRTMTVFSDIITGNAYTMAFDSTDGTSAVVVKNGYDYYSNVKNKEGASKQLAINSDFYTFNDTDKTYTKSDRKYDNQCPVFFNTSKYSLVGIDRVNEGGAAYIVETLTDGTDTYKYYWNGTTLAKIEAANTSGKILATTTFSALSATADSSAFVLPANYTQLEGEKDDGSIGLGEGDGENAQSIIPEVNISPVTPENDETPNEGENTSPEVTIEDNVTTPIQVTPVEDTPAETVPEVETVPPSTEDDSPQTGNGGLIPASIVSISSLAAIVIGKKVFWGKKKR